MLYKVIKIEHKNKKEYLLTLALKKLSHKNDPQLPVPKPEQQISSSIGVLWWYLFTLIQEQV